MLTKYIRIVDVGCATEFHSGATTRFYEPHWIQSSCPPTPKPASFV